MREVKIDTDYIKLDQLLKYADITQTGGHSKFLIKEGKVKVNGEKNTMRGKKIRKNDIVEVENEEKIIIK
ncbi:RNA-binding S4 domain-containing protein [Senegalia massiliensis]|uniref:RNA-binding S4 domain-containing protein n=1 Tax=Senegalia massiliensis TaxID=1720316 RepID=A0A845QYR7_9CLOT|nr:RNA-binding S4 domain-containing protein [Senegalia massiliensis]NBI08107.1 RNA-binding S4 domain-containing protein [Senegalia massiliensis]